MFINFSVFYLFSRLLFFRWQQVNIFANKFVYFIVEFLCAFQAHLLAFLARPYLLTYA